MILSRGRSRTITSHKLFPYATLVIPDDEEEVYKHIKLHTVLIPAELKGLSRVRNWVLDNFDEEIVIMVDDDIKSLVFLQYEKNKKIKDSAYIAQVLINAAIMADDMEVGVFGFNQKWDVRKYDGSLPFKLKTWVGGVIGVVGRKLRFDEKNMFKVDIDFCLQNLLKNRILFVDNRYSFEQERDKNLGGNSIFRTEEKVKKEMSYLKKKWKGHISIGKFSNQHKIRLKVKR